MNQPKTILIFIAVIVVLLVAGAWWWGSGAGRQQTPGNNSSTGSSSAGLVPGTAAYQDEKSGKGVSTERVENPPVPTNVAAPSAQLTPPSAPAPIIP